MVQLNPLDPAPCVKVGNLQLLALEAGRTPQGLTLSVRAENGRILDQCLVAISDVKARETAAERIAAKSGLSAQDVAQGMLELNAGAEIVLRNKRKPSGGAAEAATRYAVVEGCLSSIDYDYGGEPRARPLANFSARIAEQIVRDDGESSNRVFVIEAQRASGEALGTCRVDAAEYASLSWVTRGLGAEAIVFAGQRNRDALREGIQQLSGQIAERHVMVCTGWHHIDNRWCYLTAGGALGKPGVQVELDKPLDRYRLPEVPEASALREAVEASLRFLDVAEHRVTIPLLAAVYGAPLIPFLGLDFTLWLLAHTGALKSTLAALALSHYGKFDHHTLPASWECTANYLEKLAYLCKDALLVIDDFAPQGRVTDANSLETKANRLLRAQGNRSARGRMASDTGFRRSYHPRCVIIATGEQLAGVQSNLSRMLAVEFERRAVDLKRLSASQGEADQYPMALAGFLDWVSSQWHDLRSHMEQAQKEIRAALVNSGFHLRLPDIFCGLYLALDAFLQYAAEVNAITETDAHSLRQETEEVLIALCAAQAGRIENAKPTDRFVAIITELLAQQKVCIEPERKPRDWHPTGECLGWRDDDYIYLFSEASYTRVVTASRDQNDHFTVKAATLHKMLLSEGYLVPPSDECDPDARREGRLTLQVKRGGQKMPRVLRLDRRRVGW